MAKETNLNKAVMLKTVSDYENCRLFRNNTGKAYQGKVTSRVNRTVEIENYRIVNFGLTTGSSDLIGWYSMEITPEMVGKKVAVFAAVECKVGRGKTSPAQDQFLQAVHNNGGIAGVARSPEGASEIITNFVESMKS